jgi:hypothetical protein
LVVQAWAQQCQLVQRHKGFARTHGSMLAL